jgi:hypothetical protein
MTFDRSRSLFHEADIGKEPRSTTLETSMNECPVNQDTLQRHALLASMTKSICWEQGPSVTTDVHLINTHLYHLAYILDMESPSFTSTIVHTSCSGLPTVYKPNGELGLTLLQCGQILQDSMTEISKHYLLTNPDPYNFDPGGVLAIHLVSGVSSEATVSQLIPLGL